MKRLHFRWDSPEMALLITALIYLVFIVSRLAVHQFDPSYFVVAGDKLCAPELTPRNLAVLDNSFGYDGQFYYRIALNPFTAKQTDFGIRLDNPPWRHQRILYPFLVWLFSFGQKQWVPMVMILINYMGLCAIGWLGGKYAKALHQHALYGLLFSLYPGFILSLSRNLTEIGEMSLLLAGLWFIRKKQHLISMILITLAILARESALIMVAAIIMSIFYEYLTKRVGFQRENENIHVAWYYVLIPCICYIVWHLILFLNWGNLAISGGTEHLGLPFSGIIYYISFTLSLLPEAGRLLFIVLIYIIAQIGLVICSYHSSESYGANMVEKIGWLFYLILMILLTKAIWKSDMGIFRSFTECYILGTIIVIASRIKLRQVMFTITATMWLMTAVFRIFHM